MGSRLEKVRQNVENASRIEQKGVEQGERDASEVREIKSSLEPIICILLISSLYSLIQVFIFPLSFILDNASADIRIIKFCLHISVRINYHCHHRPLVFIV